jgi:hypothetical protein
MESTAARKIPTESIRCFFKRCFIPETPVRKLKKIYAGKAWAMPSLLGLSGNCKRNMKKAKPIQ